MSNKALATIGTKLMFSEDDGSTWNELAPIKEYPDLGGAPEMLESTDLKDEQETHELGVQSNPGLEFLCNYTKDTFVFVKSKARTPLKYKVELGDNGEDGDFIFDGQHDCWKVGGGVNAIRDFRIMIAPSSKIEIE